MAGLNDYQLQQLVDGELDHESRREVLQACQQEPDGWRRCALAFLEAQVFEEALRDNGLEEPVGLDVARCHAMHAEGAMLRPAPETSVRPAPANHWRWIAAIAATAFAAFGAGKFSQFESARSSTEPRIAINTAAMGAAAGGSLTGKEPAASPAASSGPVDLSRLITFVGQGESSRPVPMLRSAPESDAQMQQLMQWLSDRELDYTTQSGWLPVRMPNGQQALVPVQRLEVKPLAERTL